MSERSRITEPVDPEITEDFRNLLEEIVRQNAEILELLEDDDDEDDDNECTRMHHPRSVWSYIFSFETALIVLVLGLFVIVPIFSNK